MGTYQATPGANKAIEATRKDVFDLDSKAEVTLKKTGDFTPVSTMEEFVSRMANNSQAILSIVNDGLEKWTESQLAADANVPWQLVGEDDNGNETLSPFTGTVLSEEKSKSFGATVVQFAKMAFGYSKSLTPEQKKAAKSAARDAILSNPAVVEGLKK